MKSWSLNRPLSCYLISRVKLTWKERRMKPFLQSLFRPDSIWFSLSLSLSLSWFGGDEEKGDLWLGLAKTANCDRPRGLGCSSVRRTTLLTSQPIFAPQHLSITSHSQDRKERAKTQNKLIARSPRASLIDAAWDLAFKREIEGRERTKSREEKRMNLRIFFLLRWRERNWATTNEELTTLHCCCCCCCCCC